MSFSIRYQKRALAEYENAVQWYREHSERAANNFEIAVNEKIDILRSEPDRYKKAYKQFHTVALRKYPYSIVYAINEQDYSVIISSIFHHKRNPRGKYKS